MRRNQKGFTLMELMVVIVIVAILAAVAVPLYINYVKDAQRTEAKGAIGAVITAEQTYYQANPTIGYTTNLALLNVDLNDVSHNWTITVPAADPNGFTVQADGVGGQPTDKLQVKVIYARTAAPVWTEL
ncbi:MAG: prepilin-type N-terminal cleavage/methylation domain-containing protein [Candidatus Eisenbacteria bacterium]|uniref:Prepilin-type N-terminal cleavage/methylation domain-containing protein n=1 Tax=Eiseniibacteriota bacterium TaxID=2212470 RepID=A0A538U306_UNCEI|nr:MAG: prepilin-type N-terminal cleavage/methylation domain-containing protein [Candidatus Eisenbacteria bacterium]